MYLYYAENKRIKLQTKAILLIIKQNQYAIIQKNICFSQKINNFFDLFCLKLNLEYWNLILILYYCYTIKNKNNNNKFWV